MFSVSKNLASLKKLNTTTPIATFASKELSFSVDCRNKMLAGCEKLADAVQVTLGPKGRNVVIEQAFGGPKITKDGVTVAKAIEFSDRFENIGANLVKQVASKTNDEAGDGTTTATILARALFREGTKSVAAGINPMDLRRGINQAVEAVIENVQGRSSPVNNTETIANIATISANGDKEIGNLIAQLMDKVGEHGTITVQDGKALTHEIEYVEGMRFDRGFISPYFVTEQKTQKVELENPYILLAEKKISNVQSILHFLEHAMKEQRGILLICEDVESEALATLVLNKLRGGLKICAVKAPAFGDNRKAILNDIAILTGGTVISEDIGLSLEKSEPTVLGTCKKIVVSKDDTVILDGAGEKASLEERTQQIQDAMQTTTSEYDREKLQERLAKLKGGVGIIKVGGASEVEVGEIKDRIEDALCSTRAAVEEGVVPGGGSTLLYASKMLENLKGDNFDQQVGIDIVKNAIRIPCRTIAENAGKEGAVIVGKLLEQDNEQIGYNAAKDEYVEMAKEGIIDPAKVIRRALLDSSSVASLMITTECMIVDAPQEGGAAPPANPMAGMGGMGGMPGMM